MALFYFSFITWINETQLDSLTCFCIQSVMPCCFGGNTWKISLRNSGWKRWNLIGPEWVSEAFWWSSGHTWGTAAIHWELIGKYFLFTASPFTWFIWLLGDLLEVQRFSFAFHFSHSKVPVMKLSDSWILKISDTRAFFCQILGVFLLILVYIY